VHGIVIFRAGSRARFRLAPGDAKD